MNKFNIDFFNWGIPGQVTQIMQLTRDQLRFCLYLVHLICVAPIKLMQNNRSVGSTGNLLEALKVLTKPLK